MDYEMEELLPVVARLTETYGGCLILYSGTGAAWWRDIGIKRENIGTTGV